jgi:hypothetical protein
MTTDRKVKSTLWADPDPYPDVDPDPDPNPNPALPFTLS